MKDNKSLWQAASGKRISSLLPSPLPSLLPSDERISSLLPSDKGLLHYCRLTKGFLHYCPLTCFNGNYQHHLLGSGLGSAFGSSERKAPNKTNDKQSINTINTKHVRKCITHNMHIQMINQINIIYVSIQSVRKLGGHRRPGDPRAEKPDAEQGAGRRRH